MADQEAVKKALLLLQQKYAGEATELQLIVATLLSTIVTAHEELQILLLRSVEEVLESS